MGIFQKSKDIFYNSSDMRKMLIILKTVKAIIPTVSAAFSKFKILIKLDNFIIVPMSFGTLIIVFIFYSPDVKSIP